MSHKRTHETNEDDGVYSDHEDGQCDSPPRKVRCLSSSTIKRLQQKRKLHLQKQKRTYFIIDGAYAMNSLRRYGMAMDWKALVRRVASHTGYKIHEAVCIEFFETMDTHHCDILQDARIQPESCELKMETRFDVRKQEHFTSCVQKGGDVAIATRMMEWAFRKDAAHIVILTGDGDFYPVASFLRHQTRIPLSVLYIGRDTISRTLLDYTSDHVDIVREWHDVLLYKD